MSGDYKGAVRRVTEGFELTSKLWDKSPDIQRDIVAEYEALQAWVWIPSCYSLIEQAFKLLWATKEGIPAERVREDLINTLGQRAQAHNLNVLFEKLKPDDREKIGHAYRAYQSLHDYIPIATVTEFLSAIGDGYARWRYLLLEGPKGIPTTHIGAMLEIAGACVTILKNEHLTGHGFHTVDQRIDRTVRNAIGGEVRRYVMDCQRHEGLGTAKLSAVYKDRMEYVSGLLNKNLSLVYAILSDDIPSSADNDSEDIAIVKRIGQTLLKADKKNSRQYFLRKSKL